LEGEHPSDAAPVKRENALWASVRIEMILLRSIHACPPAKTSQEPLFGVSTNGNVAYEAERQVCSADYGHLMGAFRQAATDSVEPQRVVALVLDAAVGRLRARHLGSFVRISA
jgi:hypothetical protein